ncbi:hypothetical protein LCER1_G002355 [Lachnellula cervina]|uniref:3-carboxymuconate cyclase n=1 Tax=Lachnellula cervina TaxID=1316786 RepID=A0A7D8YX49_9HELO|nr:hypothetical protein LCER1_G002355 [Lachnellula cervina]
MVQLSFLLAGLAALQVAAAAPTNIALGATGRSLSISEDGTTASLDGRSIDLREAFKRGAGCKPAKGAGGGPPGPTPGAKAIYFLSNAANNSVVALKVAADGSVSDGSMTATGGAGMSGVDAAGKPAGADGLFSQGSVKIAGNTLIAVNPGSNTVSMFSINPSDPTKLTMIGAPASTLGEFPVSVTISQKLAIACVANSGAKSGIACLSMTAHGLKPLDKALRPIPLGQTTPPSGPLNTISQTFFNADSTALLTTVKGNPMVNNTGFISAFPVDNGSVSPQEMRSSPNGTAVLFGVTLLPGSNDKIFMTDASFGAATVSLSAGLIGSTAASTKIDGQMATCWATFSGATGTAFVTDVLVNHLVEIDPASGAIVKATAGATGNLGMIDLEGKGNFIYALAPGNTTAGTPAMVTVWDVSGGKGTAKVVQNFAPQGVTDTVQGMAIM